MRMALVAAAAWPKGLWQAEHGWVKAHPQQETEARSHFSRCGVNAGDIWKLRTQKAGLPPSSKNVSLLFQLDVASRSHTAAARNFLLSEGCAGFRRNMQKVSKRSSPTAAQAESDARGSGMIPGEDDMWAGTSLPSYFKEFARPPKERLNLALIASGVVFVFIMRKAIIAEACRWVLGTLAACSFITHGMAVGLDRLIDATGQHLALVLTLAGWAFLALQDAYAFIVDMTPVGALVSASVWVSAVLSLGDFVSPSATASRGVHLAAGLWGLAAILLWVSPLVFLLGLILLLAFQLVVNKTELVPAVMPVAAVLAAVGEPAVRILALGSFLALCVRSHCKASNDGQEGKVASPSRNRPPLVLVILMAFAGISVAANTLHARQLQWMIS